MGHFYVNHPVRANSAGPVVAMARPACRGLALAGIEPALGALPPGVPPF